MTLTDLGFAWGGLAALNLYVRALWASLRRVTVSHPPAPNRRLRDGFGQTWVTCRNQCTLHLTPTQTAACACRLGPHRPASGPPSRRNASH